MIHVTDAEFEIILNILKAHAPKGEVWAFGSRHKGTHRKHSDLDLAVVGNGKQPLAVIGNLKEAFVDSTLPYRVDVLDYHAAPPSFRKIIDASHEVIYRTQVRDDLVLNCATPDSTLKSLASIYQSSEHKIQSALRQVDFDSMEFTSCPELEIHQWFCGELNTSPINPHFVVWFHFTNTMEPESFKTHGLLPSDKAFPLIKSSLYKFIHNKWSLEEWDEVWEEAIKNLPFNDACKFSSQLRYIPDFGPNGMLIKDVGLYPRRSSAGEFYRRPELVEGILRVIDEKHGTYLFDDFLKKGKSCIVAFRTSLDRELYQLAAPALIYLSKHLRGENDLVCCHQNFDAKNKTIPLGQIVSIELIDFDKYVLSLFYKNKTC